MSTKVALVQCEVSDSATPTQRRERVREFVLQASAAGAQVVVLPELWVNGAFNVDAMKLQTAEDFAVFRNFVSSLAREAGVWLHGGSDTDVSEQGQRFNTSVVADSDGSIVAEYRKLHLWGGDAGEAAVLGAGQAPLALDSPLGSTGVTTCYELRFPELYRVLVDAGVHAYLVVAGWPVQRIAHWRILLQARAIENQAWVVAVNCVGTHDGVMMGGFSAVVDPQGNVVAEASGAAEEILYADIDPAAADSWRAKFAWLKDRRTY